MYSIYPKPKTQKTIVLGIVVFLLSFGLFTGLQVFAGIGSYQVTAEVKSLSIHSGAVRLTSLNQQGLKQTQVFRLCQLKKLPLHERNHETKVKVLKEALSEGKLVKVSYSSLFDRCLSTVATL